jgi:hypothetical protein
MTSASALHRLPPSRHWTGSVTRFEAVGERNEIGIVTRWAKGIAFILHRLTCRSIKLLKLSDDTCGKLNVVMTNQGKSTAKLFVDSTQGD